MGVEVLDGQKSKKIAKIAKKNMGKWEKYGKTTTTTTTTTNSRSRSRRRFFKQEIFHFSMSSKIISAEWRGLLVSNRQQSPSPILG